MPQIDQNKSKPCPIQGWQCPVCEAVMAPSKDSCINCKGNLHVDSLINYPPAPIFDPPQKEKEYYYGDSPTTCAGLGSNYKGPGFQMGAVEN